ncbi:MAG TPA: hypothetical protein VK427_12735 [Kofleriaceae bacterium]|nr:hypothetical protein [Kofleriaceae bacterium]
MRSLIALLAACTEASSPSPTTTHVVEAASFPATRVGALDLLFQVDDSGSTAHLQSDLARAIPALFAALDGIELHVGVVTSDFGTAGGPPVGTVGQGGCAGYGQGGMLQTRGAPVDGPFVIDSPDTRNYTGALGTVVGEMLRVGSAGCGFEQPLAATRAALRVNPGFLRPDASLAIIMLADEDDCSLSDPGLLTDDTLGPLQSFRCTRAGIVCDEPLDVLGEKHNCRPDTTSRYVEDPAVTLDMLLAIKPQERLTVSAIVGEPGPVAVGTITLNGLPQLALEPTCSWSLPTGPAVAHPPVRIASLVDGLASRGVRGSVCHPDYAPALARIALAIKRSLGIGCLDASQLADTLASPGLQPACEVRDVSGTSQTPLPRCPAMADCYDIVEDTATCGGNPRVVIDRKSPPAAGTRVDVYCEAPLPDAQRVQSLPLSSS